MTNFYSRLNSVFDNSLDKPCFIMPDRPEWSYGDLSSYVNKAAAVLKQQGITPGDRVVAQVEKSVGSKIFRIIIFLLKCKMATFGEKLPFLKTL